MRKIVSLLVVLMLAWAAHGQTKDKDKDKDKKVMPKDKDKSDQTYTIKTKDYPDVGKSVVVKKSGTTKVVVKVMDPSGKKPEDVVTTESEELVYSESVVEKGDKAPKKFKRVYEKAKNEKKGPKGEAIDALKSLQGRTVVFVQKDGKYEAAAEDKPELDADVKKSLASSSDDGVMKDAFLPKKAVKVNESWNIDLKALEKMSKDMPPDLLDKEKSKGTGKLVKAYKKGGKQFGVLEFDMKIVVKNPEDPKGPPIAMNMKMTLDTAIDGSSTEGTMTSTMNMEMKTMANKMSMDVKSDASMKEERSAEK